MKTTIHCDERITNIRNSIYVKLFWGIIILDTLAYLLDYFFQTSLNGWVIPLAPCVLIRECPKVCVNLQTDVR